MQSFKNESLAMDTMLSSIPSYAWGINNSLKVLALSTNAINVNNIQEFRVLIMLPNLMKICVAHSILSFRLSQLVCIRVAIVAYVIENEVICRGYCCCFNYYRPTYQSVAM